MAYKHTFNRDYDYLVHFNKNHDKKNGRFTFGDGDGDGQLDDHAHRSKVYQKYVGDNGKLTSAGRKRFGVDEAVKQKNIKKATSVMSRKMYGIDDSLASEEEMHRRDDDIKSAASNKGFINDLKNELKKIEEKQKEGDEYFSKWLDDTSLPYKSHWEFEEKQTDDSRKYLSNKYPQYKDMMELWFPDSDHSYYNKMISKGDNYELVRSMLDSDGYYDLDKIKSTTNISDIHTAVKKEYIDSFIRQYGETEVNKAKKRIDAAGSGNVWLL